jgi:phage baseplate assembly protein gpV
MSSNIVEVIRNIAQMEIKKIHTTELGIVTSVFPHASDSDKDNYECNIRLKDKGVELRKVPVATQQIGFVNILHTGDLVLVSFIGGNINSPIIVGRLYNETDRPPTSEQEEIVYKPPYTKDTSLRRLNIILPEGTVNVEFHDDLISVKVGKSSITATDTGEIQIKSEGVQQKISIIADGDVSIEAQNISIKSRMETKIESGTGMAIKSDALANIESTGPMTLKGAIININ